MSDGSIIADAARRPRPPLVVIATALAAAVLGTACAAYYARRDLTLTHYDAKAHLVVARRVVDSLTPGWEQVGAVWLPLPHLANLLPVQVDDFYRTGASAVAISILSFAVAATALAHLVSRATGSPVAAAAGALVFMLNPNVLYLQSTPMTEAMLIGLVLLGCAFLYDWADSEGTASAHKAGCALAAACWTRYEAWPVTAAALGLTLVALRRRGLPAATAFRRLLPLACWPLAAVASFFLLSRATVGEWFVSSFFVPENPSRGNWLAAAVQVLRGTRTLGGPALVIVGIGSAVVVVVGALRSRRQAPSLVVLAPLAAALLPFYAFFEGHPYRVRYMVPLLPALALVSGVALGRARRVGWLLAPLGLAIVAAQAPPLDPRAAMVVEAQWDVSNRQARQRITECLAARRPDEKVLMSMGSLAHYMQELSHAGLDLADFVHEGNHPLWDEIILLPRRHVAWIVVDERSEGGDALARLASASPFFLEGFSRRCESAGLALYRRDAPYSR